MEFPNQGSYPSHSCDLHHSHDNTVSFNPLCQAWESNQCPSAPEMLPIPITTGIPGILYLLNIEANSEFLENLATNYKLKTEYGAYYIVNSQEMLICILFNMQKGS